MTQIIDGKEFLSAADAGQQFGYTSDYVSKLAREGKINGKKIGNAWFVEERSLSSFIVSKKKQEEERRQELRRQRQEEYHNGISKTEEEVVTDTESPYSNHITFGTQAARLLTAVFGVAVFAFMFAITSAVMELQPIEKTITFFEQGVEKNRFTLFSETEFLEDSHFEIDTKPFVSVLNSLQASSIQSDVVESVGIDSKNDNNFSFKTIDGSYDRFTDTLAFIWLERDAVSAELKDDAYSGISSVRNSFLETGELLYAVSSNLFALHTHTSEYAGSSISSIFFNVDDVRDGLERKLNTFVNEGIHTFALIDLDAAFLKENIRNKLSSAYTYSLNAALGNVFFAYDSISSQVKTTTKPFFDDSFWFDTLGQFFQSGDPTPPSENVETGAELLDEQPVEPSVTTIIREPTTVVQNVTESITYTGVAPNLFETRLQQLENKLSSQLYEFTARYEGRTLANFQSIAHTNRINTLANVTITNPTIIGGSISGTSGIGGGGASAFNDLTDVSAAAPSFGNLIYYDGSEWTTIATSSLGISSGSSFGQNFSLTTNTFSQSALAPTTSAVLAINGTGTSTFAGGLEAWRQLAAPYFNATSTTATSTFAGNLSVSNLAVTGLTNCDTIDSDANGYLTCGADATGAGGGIATIKESNVQVGDPDITILDFGAGFDLTESPNTEINIALDLSEYGGIASTTNLSAFTAYFGQTATSSFAADGTLSLAGLTNSGLGVNTAGQVYAAATTTAGTGLTYTGSAFNVDLGTSITASEIADGDHGDFTYSSSVATLDTNVVQDNEIDYSAVTLTDFTNDAGFLTNAFKDWNITSGALAPTTTLGILVNASSTIAALSVETGTTTNATSTSLFTNNLTIDSLTGPLQATAGVVSASSSISAAFIENLSGTNTGDITLAGALDYLTIAGQIITRNAIDLATDITGILAAANGGTGWGEIQANSILLGNGTSQLATTTAGTNGQVLALVSGVPTWTATTTAGTGLTYTGSAFNVDLGTSIDLTSEVTGVLPDANVANDITLTNITQITNRAISDTTGTLAVARGGTGTTTAPISEVFYGGSGGVYQSVATTSLSAGSGISFTGTAGALLGGSNLSIALNATGDWTGTFDGFEASQLQEFTYDTNTFSQASLAPTTTTLNLEINGTGTSTFAGGLEAWRQLAAPYFNATSTTATSTFAGNLSVANLAVTGLTNCDTIDTDANGYLTCGADATGAGGGIATIKESTVQVGGADITILDFGAGFDLTESPDTEINVSLDLSEYVGVASTTLLSAHQLWVGQTATTSIDAAGNVTLGGTLTVGGDSINEFAGTGLTVSGNALTADLGTSVDLASEITGTLPVANGGTASTSPAGFLYGPNDGTLQGTTTISQNFIDAAIARDSELHNAVTLAGSLDYLTLSGQEITRNAIDLTTDITGDLPFSNLTQIAANSILGNITGATGDVAAIATSSLFTGSNGQILAREDGAWVGVATTTAGTGLTYTGSAFNVDLGTSVDLASEITGTLPVANGGTGATTLTGLLQGNGTGAVTAISNSSTVGQILRVTGASTYAWGALDLDDSDAITGTLAAANIDDAFLLNTGDTGTGLYNFSNATSSQLSGLEAWFGATATTSIDSAGNATFGGNIVIGSDTINEFAGAGLTVSGNALTADLGTSVDLTSEVTGILPVANGGTGASSLNDLITLGTHTTGNYLATLASSGSITVGNSGSESAAATVNLNLANANAWTGLQTFLNASSTQLSAYTAYFGGSATTSIDSAGNVTFGGNIVIGGDTINEFAGDGLTVSSNALIVATSTFNLDPSSIDLTQGYLLVGDPSGNAQATSSIFVNTSTGSVGIGTTTPEAELDVKSNTTSSDILVARESSSNDAIFRVYEGSLGAVNVYLSDGSGTDSIRLSAGTSDTYFDAAAEFGIGTTSPFAKLSVAGEAGQTNPVFQVASSSVDTVFSTITSSGDFGIGTTSPWKRLSVTETVSDAQFSISYDTTRYANFQVDSAGDLIVDAQGGDVFLNDENLWVCTGGSCPSGTPSGNGNIVAETSVLVGTTTAQQELTVQNDVYVANNFPSAHGTATSTFLGDIKIGGKLDVATIDPVYRIDGTKYATYGHSTIGIKEEVIVTETITAYNETKGKYEMRIAFSELEEGSNLWLFYQVTSFGDEAWNKLAVTLTPGFEGTVFYEKHPEKNELMVYSSEKGEVSMRLIADRFDAEKWPNLRSDQDDPFTHFEFESKK